MCHQKIIGHVCSEITRASNRLLFPLEKDVLLDESRSVNKYQATGQFYCNILLCVTMHSGWGPELFGKARSKDFLLNTWLYQLTLAKQKTVIAFGDSNLFYVVGAQYLNKAYMFKLGLT